MITNKKRLKKSVRLSDAERKNLGEYYETFDTDIDFADDLKMDRVTLKRILVIGSGSPDNIAKIQKRLKKISVDA